MTFKERKEEQVLREAITTAFLLVLVTDDRVFQGGIACPAKAFTCHHAILAGTGGRLGASQGKQLESHRCRDVRRCVRTKVLESSGSQPSQCRHP